MKSKLYLSIILIGLFFSVCEKAEAQVPDWLWAKSAGGANDEYARDIEVDASGNSYVVGGFSSATVTFGSITLTKSGSGSTVDIFIAKYDAGGNVVWAKSVGGINSESGNGIAVDANGNSYVTGSFDSPAIIFGNDTLTNAAGGRKMFIAKFDENGIAVWARSAGGQYEDDGNSITIDQTGNSYVVGSFGSVTITFDSITLTNAGTPNIDDVYIVKYDPSGTVLWAKSAGGTDNDYGVAITSDTLGNSYITGSFYSPNITFGGTVLTNANPSLPDMYIVKYDAVGNVVWAKSVNGVGYQYGRGITADVNSNIYVAGYFENTIILDTITLTSTGGNVLTMKLDSNGNTVWAKAAGNGDGFSIALDTIGNSYVTGIFGNTISFGNTTLTSAGSTDVFIAKYDTVGTVLWAKAIGGIYDDQSRGIATDASGNSYVTGFFISPNLAFDSLSVTKVGGRDIYVAKLSLCQTSSIDSIVTCNSYTSPSGNYVWSASGVYLDIVPNAAGCDSLITINLTINSTTSVQTITTCISYTSPSGNYVWTTSGVYLDTIPNSAGCDSIITTNLTVNTVDTTVTQTGNVLSANLAGITYQWLDCNNGFSIISGATNQIFAPTSIGNYAVVVAQNGCVDTSSCYSVIGVGINETSATSNFIISPNPVKDVLNVSLNKPLPANTMITISDMQGRVVGEKNTNHTYGSNSSVIPINVSALSQGVYLLRVDGVVRRFVKL